MTLNSLTENARQSKGLSMKVFITLAAGLLTIAGCASTPTRPTTPVYTGEERPTPTRPDRPDAPEPEQPTEEPETDTGDIEPVTPEISLVQPRHFYAGQETYTLPTEQDEVFPIAVLLPFSSTNAAARREAEGLLAGIEKALFDIGASNIVLLPKDTAGVPETAVAVADEAISQGAKAFIGPLFSHNIKAVSTAAWRANVPVLGFSSDKNSGGNGVYLMSIPVEEEISRIVDWASLQGVTQFAMFGPDNRYGQRVEDVLRYEAALRGATVIKAVRYDPNEPSPTQDAKLLAETVNIANEYTPGEIAVLIPERGVRLRSVAPLLPYYDVDINTVKLLGTGLWNTSEVWREPTLRGGVFPAPDPNVINNFKSDVGTAKGDLKSELAPLGYDAAMMVIAMQREDAVSRSSIERQDGFIGVNGLFRFRLDGTIERALSVLQVVGDGRVRIIEAAPMTFEPDSF